MIDPIERHEGEPLVTLADVRRPHNVVAAFPDLMSARQAIVALEQSGVDPATISLLGAWPVGNSRPAPPNVLRRRTLTSSTIGAALFAAVAAGFFVGSRFSLVWVLLGAAAAGAFVGASIGWVTATATSRAWENTFAADDDGSVAVGVHSTDPGAVGLAEEILVSQRPMAMNRFGNQ